MIFRVRYERDAQRFLKKTARYTAGIIISWIEENLERCEDPRAHGKGLTGQRSGEWSYRLGDYRIIAEIHDSEGEILITTINHRSKVYR